MRSPVALLMILSVLMLAPSASAAISIDRIMVPDRTAADHPFPVEVTLTNAGPARRVYLFGALYDPEDGRGPCGASADPRFRAFTQMVQEPIDLPANAPLKHPPQGERWLHQYRAADATNAPESAQFCVFVANASQGPLIDYETFSATAISVRARNAPPVAEFTLTPEDPRALDDVTLEASATDAEGDPVTFRWDFGHDDAGGRAKGEGARVTHAFYPAGDFVVTLTASDGIDETRISHLVTVATAEAAPSKARTPLPLAVSLGAVALALLLTRRRAL